MIIADSSHLYKQKARVQAQYQPERPAISMLKALGGYFCLFHVYKFKKPKTVCVESDCNWALVASRDKYKYGAGIVAYSTLLL